MGAGDGAAARWMALCALALSFIPLLIDLSGGFAAPFLLNALWRGAWTLGAAAIAVIGYRDLAFSARVWRVVVRRSFNWISPLMIANGLQMGLIAWSGAYVNIAAATIVFYTWPLSLAAAMALAYRGSGRYARLSGVTAGAMALGAAGAAIAGVSEWRVSADEGGVWLGLGFGFIASWLSAAAALGLRWATGAAGVLLDEGAIGADEFARAEIFCAVCVTLLAGIACSALCLIAAGYRGEFAVLDARFALCAIAGGFAVHAVGDFAWRRAALGAKSLAVMSIGCFIPLGGVIALWLFGRADGARFDALALGALCVAAANLAAGGALGGETIKKWRRLMSQSLMSAVIGRYWDPDKIDAGGAVADESIWMEIAAARCGEDCPCGCDMGDRFTPPGLCGCEEDICDECSLCDCCCHALAALSGCGQSEIRLRERDAEVEAENQFYAMLGDREGA